jgi:subtilisin family serine protease
LNEVLDLIAAPDAWNRSCGDDTYVAVIDSGIHGPHPEFPTWKRADGQSSDGSDPWDDPLGHGTMVAAIAAAAPATGARCSGVAPGAKLYSCKIALTQEGYETSAIIDAYEWIEDRREEHGHPIIVNNSFGFQTDSAPLVNGVPVTDQHPIVAAIRRLVRAGIPVVFAAGNNHDRSRCRNSLPPACAPDTIWAWNSLPEVMAVAEASDRLRPTPFSSRGPGQWAPADHPKPDCAAPTFGWILFGPSYRDTVDGWGTSGAAPQVAGLLALLASRDPGKAPRDYYDRVRATCTPVKACRRCVGHGLIHCGRAVQ